MLTFLTRSFKFFNEGTKQMQIDKIMYDVSEAITIGEKSENCIIFGHHLEMALSMLALMTRYFQKN